MGRPKKLSFPCKYCGKEFKMQMALNRHLLSHPDFASKTRVARIRSNWCPVCKRSFPASEYKRHIENEHNFDTYKITSSFTKEEEKNDTKDFIVNNLNSAKNSFTIENMQPATIVRGIDSIIPAKLCRKRGRPPGKKIQTPLSSTHIKIKTEPPDTYETSGSTLNVEYFTSNSPSVKTCKLCGFNSRSAKGMKIHFSTIHKKKSGNKSPLKKSPFIHKIEKTATFIKQEPQDEDSDQNVNSTKKSGNSQPLIITNSVPNINQIIPSGMVYNTFQNQPFNNIIHIVNPPNVQNSNQPNIQNSFILPDKNPPVETVQNQNPQIETVQNQNPQVETVPSFDCDSEKYIRWLKNFISRCKMHKYPLTPMLCQSVSHINDEITNALEKREGSLKKRSNHFYFMKIRSMLTEIMMGQLRYTMDVVKR